MYFHAIFVICCYIVQAQSADESPRIVIVGCGVSGLAAATRLLQNGFNNITILEAENRIGGRVYTVPFAGYVVDLGGQWVHGEEDNVSYEMAWPLGLLEHSTETQQSNKVYDSSGSPLPEDLGTKLIEFYNNLSAEEIPDVYLNKSIGEFIIPKVEEFLNAQQELTADQRKSLLDMLNLYHLSSFAGTDWLNLAIPQDHIICKGDQAINWKDKGYSMILDILMKKYPDPTQELPVLNHTVLNTEVAQINYNASDGNIRVVTANGDEYSAEHVIVTPSIAVLRADYKTLFNPSLPEAKINAIENIELGVVVKIYLSYPDPWWTTGNDTSTSTYEFFWREEDKNEYANNPEKSWMLGIVELVSVENKPQLLCAWVTGPYAREMENFTDNRVFEQTKEFLHRFLGKTHNLTEPTEMLRSKWFGNKHFRGTWSYRSLNSKRSGAKAHDVAEPIIENEMPLVLFAGEATHSTHPSTVHGAIDSGWREADRLIKLYADRKSSM